MLCLLGRLERGLHQGNSSSGRVAAQAQAGVEQGAGKDGSLGRGADALASRVRIAGRLEMTAGRRRGAVEV